MQRRKFLAVIASSSALSGCIDSEEETVNKTVQRSEPPTGGTEKLLEYSSERLTEIQVSGGVPKDGIPSIDNPTFAGPSGYEEDVFGDDIVFGVEIGGNAKAYPRSILAQHEIVNDTVGNENVSVTYCPLTGTAIGFKRGETEFGVSGDLINNNLVMYDRGTNSRWPQMLGTAISGELTGAFLQECRVIWTTWDNWVNQHPQTEVLTTDTGFLEDYSSGVYGSYQPRKRYYELDSKPLRSSLKKADTYPNKSEFLVGRTDTDSYGVRKNALREQNIVSFKDGVTAVYDPTLDTGYLYVDAETDVLWRDGQVKVNSELYSPADLPFQKIHSYDSMWFAWNGFYPNSLIRS